MATALRYYTDISESLGCDFYERTYQAEESIRDWPLAGREITDRVRKQRIRKFPYALLYRIEPDHIQIVRLVHLKGHPKNWKP